MAAILVLSRMRLPALVLVALVSGCSGIQPWERDLMAKPAMAIDSDPALTAYDEHTYFSKEASSGGRSFGGGGCGCN
jgi:hypothetical protein